MKLIVAPVPSRNPITLEGETVVIQKATRVADTPYYRRHIEAGDLAEVSDLDEVVEPLTPISESTGTTATDGEAGNTDSANEAGSEEDAK